MNKVDWLKPLEIIVYPEEIGLCNPIHNILYHGGYPGGMHIVSYVYKGYNIPNLLLCDDYGNEIVPANVTPRHMVVRNVKIKKTVWINLFKWGAGLDYFDTKEDAENFVTMTANYLKAIPVEIEVEV